MDNLQSLPVKKTPIPIDQLIALRDKNLSYSQIGKIVGCDPSNVFYRLQRIDMEGTGLFEKNRANFFRSLQLRFLQTINDEDIKKAPIQTRVWAASVLYDKEKIETGKIGEQLDYNAMPVTQVTQNIQVNIGKLSAIVGKLPVELRDQVSKLLPSSLSTGDKNGSIVTD